MSKEMRGRLSFDTSGLPTGVTILSAKLRLKQGTDSLPFGTLGYCWVDITAGSFGTINLESGDFSDEMDVLDDAGEVQAVDSGAWAEARLSHEAFGYIQTGAGATTQFRLHFDESSVSDTYVGWYSGDSSDPPQLVVTYSQ
jgi:hypothetical protein